jgi:hypothetical protein
MDLSRMKEMASKNRPLTQHNPQVLNWKNNPTNPAEP